MSRAICDFKSIRDVLKASVGRRVPIIFDGGRRLVVEVVAVKGNLLVASVRCRILTINISCICAVVINCAAVLKFLLDHDRKRRSDEGETGNLRCTSRKCRRRTESRFHSLSRFSDLGEDLLS